MGLFDFIKGQFIDIIEWVDYSRDVMVWKFPDQDKEVKMGAQLTVREAQAAILINEGKMADVFEPGRHELTTRNMPIMTTINSWKYGFDSPFKVDIYFFNTRQFTDNKWGTPSPVTIPDSKFGQVEFRAFGSYNFRITDFETFFKEFAGTNPVVSLSDIDGMLRGKLVDRFTEIVAEMAENDFSFVQMQANKTEFVQALQPRIADYLTSFGLELTDFSIQSITLPPELQEYLRKNTQMNMVGDMNRFMQFQAANAVQKSAENPGGGNAGIDMGTGLAMGQMMMNQMAQGNAGGNNAAPAMSEDEKMEIIDKWFERFKDGKITEEEYNAKKAEIMGNK
ncbi:MAG: SPFH domain-containing protein [Bacteroidota bacterium]